MLITQLKIFISSTIVDLPSERKAALKAVENVGGFPVMSEFTMEAQNTDSVTACLSKVRDSDIYVLILGGKYGWQPDQKESITELEYKTAIASKIPILVFNTTYPKDDLQKEFERRVESSFFRKKVTDAFELQEELEKSLKVELEKVESKYFAKTEYVYSNLTKISFPKYVYKAELDLDKKAIKKYCKEKGRRFWRPSLHDFAVSALYMHQVSFPHDWILWGKSILTFHNLQDPQLPLAKIIDLGTAEKLLSEEIYTGSEDDLHIFKYLLKKCLEAKLHKLKIKWIKEEKLFAFLPIKKDANDRWMSRSIEWSKFSRKATRKVVDVKRDLKNPEEVFNMRCLAFRTKLELLGNTWFLSLKPDYIFLWKDLKVSQLGYKNIQWLKRNERNMHVFNHFNFILRYLQPSQSESLFEEFEDYRFIKIGEIEKFEFSPIVPDSEWVNLEEQGGAQKLSDSDGNVDLFII